MSQRLRPAARAAITEALSLARREGAREVRADHLLAAVLSGAAGEAVLRQLDPELDTGAVLADVERARRRAGLSASDAEALAGLGIDLGRIVERVEAELGEGALDPAGARSRSTWRGPAVSSEFERVLLVSYRQALARGDRRVDVEHLLLGLLDQPGLAADALTGRAITSIAVLAVLDARDSHQGTG